MNQPLWQIFYAIGKIFVVVNHWQNNLSKHLGFELVSHNWGDAKETSFFLFFVFSFELCWQFNPIQFISLHQRKIYRRTPKTSKMPKTYILTTIFGPYSVNVWHPFRHALSTESKPYLGSGCGSEVRCGSKPVVGKFQIEHLLLSAVLKIPK